SATIVERRHRALAIRIVENASFGPHPHQRGVPTASIPLDRVARDPELANDALRSPSAGAKPADLSDYPGSTIASSATVSAASDLRKPRTARAMTGNDPRHCLGRRDHMPTPGRDDPACRMRAGTGDRIVVQAFCCRSGHAMAA